MEIYKIIGKDGEVVGFTTDNINTILEEWEKLEISSEKERNEYEEKKKTVFVAIKIPAQIFGASTDLQKKVAQAKLFFSDLKTTIDDHWMYVLSNINLKHIRHILKTQAEYDALIKIWVEFSQKIDDLFV